MYDQTLRNVRLAFIIVTYGFETVSSVTMPIYFVLSLQISSKCTLYHV